MFYANMAIDSIQDAKITFLKQTVKEDTLKNLWLILLRHNVSLQSKLLSHLVM